MCDTVSPLDGLQGAVGHHAALGRQVMMLWTGTLRLLLVEGVPRKQRRWWQAVSMEAPCSLTLGLGPPGGLRQLYL